VLPVWCAANARGNTDLGFTQEKIMKIYKLGRALFGAYFVYNGVNHFLTRKTS